MSKYKLSNSIPLGLGLEASIGDETSSSSSTSEIESG